MAAESFPAPVQLFQTHLIAPFPALDKVRRRSSSLNAPVFVNVAFPASAPLTPRLPRASEGGAAAAGLVGRDAQGAAEMPGRWSNLINGNNASKQKVTPEGRERRLSAAGAGKQLLLSMSGRASGAAPPAAPAAAVAVATISVAGNEDGSDPDDLHAISTSAQFRPKPSHAAGGGGGGRRVFAATWDDRRAVGGEEQQLQPSQHRSEGRPDVHNELNQKEEGGSSDEADHPHLTSPLLLSRQDRDRESDSCDVDTSISEQRAQAYAVLTAASPTASPARRSSSTRIPHVARSSPTHRGIIDVSMAAARISQPALMKMELDGRAAAPPSVLPRRRTTSSNDAPSMAERAATGQRSPLAAISASSPASQKAPRRTRVQSANAASTSQFASAVSPAGTAAAKGARRGTSYSSRRRSLSAENSLVATRLARAFLARELGEKALTRKGVALCASAAARWPADDSEQRDLWTALHDGVLLCRLINGLVPHSVRHIDRRDLPAAKAANVTNFVAAAKARLPLQPHEFFEVEQLSSGSSHGFERVLHTICAIAEYVTLRQQQNVHSGAYEASLSTESLLLPSPLSRMGSPLIPPLPASPTPGSSYSPTLPSPTHRRNSSQLAASPVSPALQQFKPAARATSPASSPAQVIPASSVPRPSRLLSSSSGIKIRSRTGSRPTSVSPTSPDQGNVALGVTGIGGIIQTPRSRMVSPPATAIEAPANRRITFASSTASSSSASSVSTRSRHSPSHSVYSNNADRRMSESAVEIMTVLQEGEEMPAPRRAASDRPVTLGTRTPDGDCTPVKISRAMLERRKSSNAVHSARSSMDLDSSVDDLSTVIAPSPRLVTGSRASVLLASTSSGESGNQPSPRMYRRRLSSELPIRAKSVSPSPIGVSSHVPFPAAGMRSHARPPQESHIPRLSVEAEDFLEEDSEARDYTPSPSPQPPSPAPDKPAARPRQHKRWNSEVFDQPLNGSRLRHDPTEPRSRHDSFMSPPSAGLEPPALRKQGGSDAGRGLRRRSTDKAYAADGARQKLVVSEPGKAPVTYQLGECIGKGQFGSVYRALNIHTGSVVAVKRIQLAGKSEEEIIQLQKEVDLLKRLSHPSVVTYEGLVRTEHYVNIILEYVENGSLQHTLNAFGILPEALVASYVVKILEGLSYLHSVHVIHRDLKAANLLTTKNGNVKLSDFGVSLQLNAVHNTIENADATGTPNWMAPEVIKLERATFASDIWSLACTIVELLTGKPPYHQHNAMTSMYRIVEDPMPPLPPGCSPELEDFLTQCFAKEPEQRPTADALFEHAWLRKHWHLHKMVLRPQDSIPFIRRISSEYHRRSSFMREPSSSSEVPELDQSVSSPGNSSLMARDDASSPQMSYAGDSFANASACEDASSLAARLPKPRTGPVPGDQDVMMSDLLRGGRNVDAPEHMAFSVPNAYPFPLASSLPPPIGLSENGPAHDFVKTTFSKPIECKLCHQHVRKYAVLCQECGLICHSKCKEFAPVPCDLRSQLLGLASPPGPQPTPSPMHIPHSATSPMLACSVPLMEPSPLTSPSQFAFHSKFGIGNLRKSKGSPIEAGPESSPGRGRGAGPNASAANLGGGLHMLRTRTSSPDAGFRLPLAGRPRPASFASSSSLPISRREGNASSISSSSDSHPLSATASIPEDSVVSPFSSTPASSPQQPPFTGHSPSAAAALPSRSSLLLSRRSLSAPGKPTKPTKSKHGKKESSGDCIIA